MTKGWPQVSGIQVNLDNNRGNVPDMEIHSMLVAWKPDWLAYCEGEGNPLSEREGYRLIRDTSTSGRQNVGLYLREDAIPEGDIEVVWHDMKRGWKRPEHPDHGQHPPRSILVVNNVGGDTTIVVAHEPDPRANRAAKMEHRRALAKIAVRRMFRPLIVAEDSNGNAPWIMAATGLRRSGHKVDVVLYRRFRAVVAEYAQRIPVRGGVMVFKGDHGDFLKWSGRVNPKFWSRREVKKA